MSAVQIKRVYEPPSSDDGFRVLVDRLWPRGLKRDAARIDLWLKEVAPSENLRRWFGHDPARWADFQKRYRAELAHKAQMLEELRELMKDKPVTLLFAAKDMAHNNAVVLRGLLSGECTR